MGKKILFDKRAVRTALLFFSVVFLFVLWMPQNCFADTELKAEESEKVIVTDFENFDETDAWTSYRTIIVKDSERNKVKELLPLSFDVRTSDGTKTIPVKWKCQDDIEETEYDMYTYELVLQEGYMLSDELKEKADSYDIVLPFVNVRIAAGGDLSEAESSYPFSKIRDKWQDMDDDKFNQYIMNNTETEIHRFLSALTESELELLLEKDTMLLNETTFEDADGNRKSKKYYKYLLEDTAPKINPMARATTYTSASGYCFFTFKDTHSGYEVLYKLTCTLASTADPTSATSFTVSSTVAGTSGSNTNNVDFSKNSGVIFGTGGTTKQVSTSTDVGLGSAVVNGETVYKTKTYEAFVFTLKFVRPAYTYVTTALYDSPLTSADAASQNGRFNFKEYNWQNTGTETVDTLVKTVAETDSINIQIGMKNLGIKTTSTNNETTKTYHSDVMFSVTHPKLNITYNANGGSGSMSSSAFTYNLAGKFSANAFTKTGYTFAGWGNSSTSGVKWNTSKSYSPYSSVLSFTSGSDKSTFPKTVNAYAQWEINKYSIEYDLDGGSVSDNPITYTVESPDIKLKNPTRTGYTFLGWSGSNGSIPQANVTIAKGSVGNKSYKANWKANEYTIKYDGNGSSSGNMADSVHTYNEAEKLSSRGFKKQGYMFTKWTTEPDGTGLAYEDKQSILNLTDEDGKMINLYAQWKENVYELPVLTVDSSKVYQTGDEVFFYVSQKTSTMNVDTESTYSEFKLNTPLPEGFTYADARVFDGRNTDITSAGTLSYDDNTRLLTFTFDDEWLNNEANYNGQIVTLRVSAKVQNTDAQKSTCALSAYSLISGRSLNTNKSIIEIRRPAVDLTAGETDVKTVETDFKSEGTENNVQPATAAGETTDVTENADSINAGNGSNTEAALAARGRENADNSADYSTDEDVSDQNIVNEGVSDENVSSVDTSDPFNGWICLICILAALYIAGAVIKNRSSKMG